jgi:hypothetical protein
MILQTYFRISCQGFQLVCLRKELNNVSVWKHEWSLPMRNPRTKKKKEIEIASNIVLAQWRTQACKIGGAKLKEKKFERVKLKKLKKLGGKILILISFY